MSPSISIPLADAKQLYTLASLAASTRPEKRAVNTLKAAIRGANGSVPVQAERDAE